MRDLPTAAAQRPDRLTGMQVGEPACIDEVHASHRQPLPLASAYFALSGISN